ncbi:MAG TPA: IS1634 family transposase [Candidatus Pullilachnospira intestinigallinarum]|nr:IS1634 family transposase [Candidatus Pullilachnospira intestinigallinarum]
MYLKKTPNSHGRIRLSIVDTYYDKAKKCSRQKTVESIGWLDELEKQYDDPIAHFTKRVAELNAEKQKKQAPILFTFYDSDRLCIGDDLRKNFGYAALSRIYHELGIHTFLTNRQRHSKERYDANAIMKMLVYSRLLFPASKKSSYDGRERFFDRSDYSLDDVYRFLSFLDKHRENLQIWMNDRIKKNYGRDTSLIYYDVTNYYFETDEQNGFLHKGISKEHRPNPIIQMGLFMDNRGIPITYELFPGNTNDCLTYRPNFGRIKKQFDLGRVISVADKGMTTGDNIWYTINTPTHDGYVFSMSIRGAEKGIKDYVLKEEGYEWLGTEYKRKSRKSPRTILVTSVTGKKMKKQVDEKQVVFWSEKYAKRAKAERETALAKARDLAQNPGNYTRATSYGAAKYVKKIDYDKETGEILAASSILDIDEEKIREEEALDGYYMLLTSEIEATDDEIIDMYRGLWRIEESFKVTKSELEARPVYVWTKEHIEAHFLICFVALTIARILENKLEHKYSVGKILDSLSKAECSLVQQNYYLFDYYDEILKEIGLIMDIDFGKRIRTLGEIKKILAKTKK